SAIPQTPNAIYINPTDYPSVNGLSPKLRLTISSFVNATAPAVTFTFGLYPITAPGSAGGAGVRSHTIGTVVTGSTITLATPSANTNNASIGSDFAMPAAGWYVICVTYSAGIAASSWVELIGDIQLRYT